MADKDNKKTRKQLLTKVDITEKLLKEIEDSDTLVFVTPAVRRYAENVPLENKEDILKYLKSRPPGITLNKRLKNYVVLFDEKHSMPAEEAHKKGFSLWRDRYRIELLFPEILAEYDKDKAHISKAGCSSCARRGRERHICSLIADIINKDPSRKLPEDMKEALQPILDTKLSHKIKRSSPPGTIVAFKDDGTPILNEPAQHRHKTLGWRPSCPDCVLKHLGQALILFQESESSEDYRIHRWIAVGHMAEAESELLSSFPEDARRLRKTRLAIMEDEDYKPDLTELMTQVEKKRVHHE